jgi:hypothetical protein
MLMKFKIALPSTISKLSIISTMAVTLDDSKRLRRIGIVLLKPCKLRNNHLATW